MSTTPVRHLVAWGGDRRSDDALTLGAVMARTFGAELHVAYVLRQDSPLAVHHSGEADFQAHVEREAAAQLRKALRRVVADLPVTTHIRRATSVSHGILQVVSDIDASLLVIGAGAKRGTGLAVGPTASSLLHASHVPVALAPSGFRERSPQVLDELVAAIGTRPGAQLVAATAVNATQRVGLPLRLISLVEVDKRHGSASAAGVAEAERALRQVTRGAFGSTQVRTQVGQGKSLKAAVRQIDWNPGSVLLVGSSRLAQGHRIFLGTTAARIMRHLPIPLVIVPRDG